MNSCKYLDCGWCYAPDDVETSASSQSACFDPDYCPYLKSQMTKEETLECEIKEYTLEIEQKAKEIGNLKDILDRKEQELKQMKETDISTVLIEGDTITIMGVKYKRVEEPKPKVRTLYDICVEWNDDDDDPPVSALIFKIEKEWTPLNLNQKEKRGYTDGYSMGFDDALNLVRKTLK